MDQGCSYASPEQGCVETVLFLYHWDGNVGELLSWFARNQQVQIPHGDLMIFRVLSVFVSFCIGKGRDGPIPHTEGALPNI